MILPHLKRESNYDQIYTDAGNQTKKKQENQNDNRYQNKPREEHQRKSSYLLG